MAEIIGVMAVINGKLADEILQIWNSVELKYNSKGVQSFNQPNLSFQGGECENILVLMEAIDDLCNSVSPIEIIVDGFGYFKQPLKVIYLKVVNTDELRQLHENINKTMEKYCSTLFDYYTPENWIPHITVAMGDLTNENFLKFKKDIEEQHPYFRQVISGIQLVKVCENGRIDLIKDCTFKGNK